MLVTAVALLALFLPRSGGGHLVISDYHSGEELARYPIEPGEGFSVEFLHSINRTPVRDYYVICEDGRIHNTSCKYYSYGTGVQTELGEGETLRYEDGAMVIENIQKYHTELLFSLLTSSTHVLRLGEEEIFLPGLLDEDRILVFAFEK